MLRSLHWSKKLDFIDAILVHSGYTVSNADHRIHMHFLMAKVRQTAAYSVLLQPLLWYALFGVQV